MRSIKRLSALLLALFILLPAGAAFASGEEAAGGDIIPSDAPALPDVEMALLYEESTDTLLYAKDIETRNEPASMTKVMTAMLVLEHDGDLSGTYTVPADAVSAQYCSWMERVHLLVGEELKVYDLMEYLLVASGNEAATTLAMYVTGNIPAFVKKMNEKAVELGMMNTHYADPHGLSTHSSISSADMLTLARYAMQNPLFRQLVATRSGRLPANSIRKEAITYNTTNRVMSPRSTPAYMTNFSDDIIGIKTGSTRDAGYNLSACMVKGDLTFYSVVMQGREVERRGSTLYSHYLSTIELFRYAQGFEKTGFTAGSEILRTSMQGSKTADLPLTIEEDLFILAQEGEQIFAETHLEKIGRRVEAGQIVGMLTLRDAFGNVRETPLVAMESIAVPFTLPPAVSGAGCVLVLVAFIMLRKKEKQGKKA
ncbi:MAG: D-alanyl-D-alanine carboxypeptidase [Clostridia bacterium]|nr:D-alanyl-D-alanine carboxypeptidase [Clostridia bacterium]